MSGWHKKQISDISLEFGVDINSGRMTFNSKRKRASKNDVFQASPVDPRNIVRDIASDASLILLTITYIIYAVIGCYFESMIAIAIVLISFLVACYIRFRSEKNMRGSYSILVPKARVIENGKRLSLSALDVEVGDLIYFFRGDVIPADARLISSEELIVAERNLIKPNEKSERAEFHQVKKSHELVYTDDNISGSYDNMVYAGSIVVSGKGRAIVTAIGSETIASRKNHSIRLDGDNNYPEILTSFRAYTKRFSLIVLLAIIPISLITVFCAAQGNNDTESTDILYTFLSYLAVSVVSMGELISAPASLIVSGTLFSGKVAGRGISKPENTEKLSAIDTLFILCPEVLVDKRHFVRRVFYSDKEFRFDLLNSSELKSFSSALQSYISANYRDISPKDLRALKRFVMTKGQNSDKDSTLNFATFQICDNIKEIDNCRFFRTDGGSLWEFSRESRKALTEHYFNYIELGLQVHVFVSFDEKDQASIFEGMVAIGEEYPFIDGDVFSECIENHLTPILVLEKECDSNIKFVINSGLVKSIDQIVLASSCAEPYDFSIDASADAKVYIGFGRNGTKALLKQYVNGGRKVLPIIKDLSDKSVILPINVYASHCEYSAEFIQHNTSLSLGYADAEDKSGGVRDALASIKSSRLACAKLNVFKRYLTFSAVLRITMVMLAILFNAAVKPITALMILLSGIIPDGIALNSILASKCSRRSSNNDIGRLPTFVFAAAGFIVALVSYVSIGVLFKVGCIQSIDLQTVQFYLLLLNQLITLGGFLLALNNDISIGKFNFSYVIALMSCIAWIFVQNWIPEDVYTVLAPLALSRVELVLLPILVLPGILSFCLLYYIGKNAAKFIK